MNIEDIEGLEDRLDTKADVVHPHATSDITGLVEILAEKAPLDHTHDISDFPDISDAIGQSFAPSVHQHTVEQVTGLQGALNLKSNTGHGHSIAQVTGLQTALDGKSSTGHGHEISEVTNLQNSLNAKSNTGHGHAISEITNLQTTLDGKATADHEHEISDIDGLSVLLAANGNVQSDWDEGNDQNAAFVKNKPNLGTAAVRNVGTGLEDVAAGSHTHSASDITSGTIALERLPVIPGTTTIVSSGGLEELTDTQLNLIISGSSVVTTDGTRYVYSGTGDKRTATNYIVTSTVSTNYENLVGAPGFASTLEGGLMSVGDKIKLNGIESGANKYEHPTNDGDLHVPATGTSNDGQVLMAGNAAKTFSWKPVAISNVTGLQNALDAKSGTGHGHGNLKADGSIGSVAGKIVVTGEGGRLTVGDNVGTAPTHTHGQITNDGRVGDQPNRVLVTGSGGAVQALASGTSGQVLSLGAGGAPTWSNQSSYTHPTGDGNLHVPATGTSNGGKVLTAGATAGSISWQTPTAASSVENITGGSAGQLLFQTGNGTTGKVIAGSSDSIQFLRSQGASASGPIWTTVGNIVFKNSNEFVGTDSDRSVLKIQKISQLAYDALPTKETATLYIVV